MTPLAPALPAFAPWTDGLCQWAFLMVVAVLVIAAWHGLRGGRK